MTIAAGLDVARFGQDMTAYCALDDTKIFAVDEWGKVDTRTSMERVLELCQGNDVEALAIDDTGVGGAVTDGLLALPPDECPFLVLPVNFGERAYEDEYFHNRGSEIWWGMREAFDPSSDEALSLPKEHTLINRLIFQVAGATHGHDKRRRTWVSKDGGRRRKPGDPEPPSPDLADALALALEAWRGYWREQDRLHARGTRTYHRGSFLGG